MTKHPTFTPEELYFIESSMDNQASHAEDRLRAYVHEFMLFNAQDLSAEIKNSTSKKLMGAIQEMHRTINILKSIRDKLEEARKQ